MRCADCQNENPDGAAFCEVCSAPLTGYGMPVPGFATAETLRKLKKVSTRPFIIPWMAALMAAAAVFGPLGAIFSQIRSHPAVNAEGTNYAGSAFNAVGIALAAIVFVPLGIAILISALGVITQRTWAWYAGTALLAVLAIAALFGFMPGLLLRVVVAAIVCVVGLFWFQAGTRAWYGT